MRSRPIIRSSYLDPEVAAHLSEIELCGAFLYTNVRQKSFSAGTTLTHDVICAHCVAERKDRLIALIGKYAKQEVADAMSAV